MLIGDLGDGAELRLLELRHAPDYHKLVCENLARLYWLSAEPTAQDSYQRVRAGLQRLVDGAGIEGGIFDHGRLCGVVGLFRIDTGQQTGEIGYWIARDAEGRGLVTRSCRAVLRHGFEDLGLQRIELRCGATNRRSIAVAERLGFQLEGRLRQADRVGDWRDDFLVYGLLAGELRAGTPVES
jgi:ribosomal-protein-serine acetyltransferase